MRYQGRPTTTLSVSPSTVCSRTTAAASARSQTTYRDCGCLLGVVSDPHPFHLRGPDLDVIRPVKGLDSGIRIHTRAGSLSKDTRTDCKDSLPLPRTVTTVSLPTRAAATSRTRVAGPATSSIRGDSGAGSVTSNGLSAGSSNSSSPSRLDCLPPSPRIFGRLDRRFGSRYLFDDDAGSGSVHPVRGTRTTRRSPPQPR